MGFGKKLLPYAVAAAVVWLLAGWMATLLPNEPHLTYKAQLLAQALAIPGCGLLLFPGWRARPGANAVEIRNPLPPGEGRVRAKSLIETTGFAQSPAISTLTPTPLPKGEGFTNPTVPELAGWCLLISLALPVQGLLAGAANLSVLKLTLAVFLLGLFMHGCVFALSPPVSGNTVVPRLALCIFIMLCAIPVWMGPWMELLQGECPFLFQTVLWICPPAYLAGLFDYDFLREQWFYQHTPFGMLRYDYPDGGWTSLILAGCSVWLLRCRQSDRGFRLHDTFKFIPFFEKRENRA